MGRKKRVAVSIIVPVLNAIDYIDECLESALNQTLGDIEIICVDAGSDDGTYERIEYYKENDNRIVLIKSNYKSYGYQMNLGIHSARGEYIGLIEADDYVDCNMFFRLYEVANEKKLDVVKSDNMIFYGDKNNRTFIQGYVLQPSDRDLYSIVTNYTKDFRIMYSNVTTWSGIYNRDFLLQNDIMHNETPGAAFQDNGFWLQVMIYAKRIFFLNEAYYNLRRDNEKSSVFSKEKTECLHKEFKYMRNCIIKRGVDKEKLLQFLWEYRFKKRNFDIGKSKYEDRKYLIKLIASEMKEAILRGELVKTNENEILYNEILFLSEYPERFFEENYLLNEVIVDRIKGASKVYIYGAGLIAQNSFILLNGINRMDEKFMGFVVSDTKVNPPYYNNKKVWSIDSLMKDDLVIIGVSEKYINDVKKSLEERNIANYVEYNILIKK